MGTIYSCVHTCERCVFSTHTHMPSCIYLQATNTIYIYTVYIQYSSIHTSVRSIELWSRVARLEELDYYRKCRRRRRLRAPLFFAEEPPACMLRSIPMFKCRQIHLLTCVTRIWRTELRTVKDDCHVGVADKEGEALLEIDRETKVLNRRRIIEALSFAARTLVSADVQQSANNRSVLSVVPKP